TAGDLKFLVRSVAGKDDHLHTVAQGGLDGVEHICRRHEHHVREVEWNTEIIVPESEILFGVEHFEESRAWVAAKIRADLVDLIEHNERVVGSCLLDRLNDASRHRPDVCASMAANFRFVMEPSEA